MTQVEIYQKMRQNYAGKVFIGPSPEYLPDKVQGYAQIRPDGDIYLKHPDPYILAHEIGHTRSTGSAAMLLANAIGTTGNLVWNISGQNPYMHGLIDMGTHIKERAADKRALDVWKEIGTDPETLTALRKRYAVRYR